MVKSRHTETKQNKNNQTKNWDGKGVLMCVCKREVLALKAPQTKEKKGNIRHFHSLQLVVTQRQFEDHERLTHQSSV